MSRRNKYKPDHNFDDFVQDFGRIRISKQKNREYDKEYYPKAKPLKVYCNKSAERPFWVKDPNEKRDSSFALIKIQNKKQYNKIVGPILDDSEHDISISGVYKIVNRYLKRQFELKTEQKEEIFNTVEIQRMYHATNPNNISGICANNFNWRLGGKSRGHKYGYGVSFTPDPSFAHQFCRSKQKALFVAKVLIGHTHVGSEDLHLPREDCDTTRSPLKTVFVKFEDCEFYPEYVVYYTLKKLENYVDTDDSDGSF